MESSEPIAKTSSTSRANPPCQNIAANPIPVADSETYQLERGLLYGLEHFGCRVIRPELVPPSTAINIPVSLPGIVKPSHYPSFAFSLPPLVLAVYLQVFLESRKVQVLTLQNLDEHGNVVRAS